MWASLLKVNQLQNAYRGASPRLLWSLFEVLPAATAHNYVFIPDPASSSLSEEEYWACIQKILEETERVVSGIQDDHTFKAYIENIKRFNAGDAPSDLHELLLQGVIIKGGDFATFRKYNASDPIAEEMKNITIKAVSGIADIVNLTVESSPIDDNALVSPAYPDKVRELISKRDAVVGEYTAVVLLQNISMPAS